MILLLMYTVPIIATRVNFFSCSRSIEICFNSFFKCATNLMWNSELFSKWVVFVIVTLNGCNSERMNVISLKNSIGATSYNQHYILQPSAFFFNFTIMKPTIIDSKGSWNFCTIFSLAITHLVCITTIYEFKRACNPDKLKFYLQFYSYFFVCSIKIHLKLRWMIMLPSSSKQYESLCIRHTIYGRIRFFFFIKMANAYTHIFFTTSKRFHKSQFQFFP